MKVLKRTGSFALAVLLVFALSTAALAEDGGADTLSQSVTITNLVAGETVKAYRLISYTDGYNAYTADASFGAYLNGLSDANAKDPSKWNSDSVDITKLLEGYVAACSGGGTPTLPALYGEKTADGTGCVTFTLAPGYYMMLVSTTLTSGKVYRPLSVFVKVTGEKSEVFGGGQSRALTVPATLTAKGEAAPELDKMVKTASSTWSKTDDAAVGDTVSFYLKVTVPYYTDISDVSLAVEDTLTNLVYNGDAKLYDAVPGGSANEIADAMTAANDGGKLTFTLNYAKLMTAGTVRTVYIGYTATVAASAAAGGNHSASNTAKLVYGNAAMPDELLQTPSVATTVYNFSFALDKYFIDANDNFQPLDGAEFTFYTDVGCTNALTFTKVGDVYRPALAGETGVTAVPALVREPGVTGATANLTICGLDAGTYYMKETKTPKGYAPPAGAYRMTLVRDGETGKLHQHDSSFTSASSGTIADADNDLFRLPHFSGSDLERLDISFLNTKLPALPSTGGIGTAVFTVGGVAVMALAVVLLLCRKKKEN